MSGFFVSAAMLILLGGCWTSKTPLMPASARDDSPFSPAYTKDDSEVMRVAKAGVGLFEFAGTEGATGLLGIDRLGPGRYLAEYTGTMTLGPAYVELILNGNTVTVYDFNCDRPNIARQCEFNDYASVRADAMAAPPASGRVISRYRAAAQLGNVPAASSADDVTAILQKALETDARYRWKFNQLVSGSAGSASRVTSSGWENYQIYEMKYTYTIPFLGNDVGWVRAAFKGGNLHCLMYHDNQNKCFAPGGAMLIDKSPVETVDPSRRCRTVWHHGGPNPNDQYSEIVCD
jgi:hypothetical protein